MEERKLYVVPTPIGNLKDITLRALEVLKNADLIAAEDTRQTLKLLNHFEIKKPLISYHKYNEENKSSNLIELIEKENKTIALVSDAGTPGVSDPGSVIIKKCIEQSIPFEVLPGATAITTALVYSGLDTTMFAFRGFLPRDNKERKAVIDEIINYRDTIIFYEAPHRLLETLKFLFEKLGDRNVSICRELTKLYQEIYRGKISESIMHFQSNKPRGEFVIVLEGKRIEEIEKEKRDLWIDLTIEEHIISYMDKGLSKKEAIKRVAKDRKLPKNEIYKFSIEL